MSHPCAAVPTSLQITKDNAAPLYEQLVTQFRYLIAGGVLGPGARLPSVRSVSSSLLVNPITVSKAYDVLHREGLVIKEQGNGTFVSETVTDRLTHSDRLKMLTPLVDQLAEHARVLGVSNTELLETFQATLEQPNTRSR